MRRACVQCHEVAAEHAYIESALHVFVADTRTNAFGSHSKSDTCSVKQLPPLLQHRYTSKTSLVNVYGPRWVHPRRSPTER